MIFKKYIVNESFWVEINNFGIEQPPGLSVESKTLLERIMNVGCSSFAIDIFTDLLFIRTAKTKTANLC